MGYWLSRSDLDTAEWSLNSSSLFLFIQERFGRLIVDLFASPSNYKVPQFPSCFPYEGAEEIDLLMTAHGPYAYPPMLLISRVLHRTVGVMVTVPYWARHLVNLSVDPALVD